MTDEEIFCAALVEVNRQASARGIPSTKCAFWFLATAMSIADSGLGRETTAEEFLAMIGLVRAKMHRALTKDPS